MSSPAVCDTGLPLFERQVAGTASAEEAARLATHALACPICAAALRRVAEADGEHESKLPSDPPVTPAMRARLWRARHPLMVTLGALAVLAGSGATLWYTVLRPRPEIVVVRGRGGDLRLMGTWEPGGPLRLMWPRSPGAAEYHVRLTGASGSELARTVAQPVLVLQPSEVSTLGDMTVVVEPESGSAERSSQSTSLAFPKLGGR